MKSSAPLTHQQDILETAITSVDRALQTFSLTSPFFKKLSANVAKATAIIPEQKSVTSILETNLLTTIIYDYEVEKYDESEDLLDAAPLLEYIKVYNQALTLINLGDTDNAKIILINLKNAYPDYPEAFVKLGDLFNSERPAHAFKYYADALRLFPFDFCVELKLAYLIKKHPELAIHDFENVTVENSLRKFKLFEANEKQFRALHQKYLHSQLRSLDIDDNSPLTAANVISFSDDLTGGAMKYVFYGTNANTRNLPTIAKYFFSRAILINKHDFLAKTDLGLVLATLKAPKKAIAQLTRIAKEYEYANTYYYLYKIYKALKNYSMARANLARFLIICQLNELESLNVLRTELTEFLQYNVFDENETIKHKREKRTDIKSIMTSTTPSGMPFKELMANVANVDNPEYLPVVSEKILIYPGLSILHRARALHYSVKQELNEALLDFTLAIWYANKNEECIQSYFERCCLHIRSGEARLAKLDYNYIFQLMKTIFKTDLTKHHSFTIDLAGRASEACLQAGDNFANKTDYARAEKLYRLGISISPTLKLYTACAVVLEKLERNPDTILAMLTDDIKFANFKGMEFTRYNSLYKEYKTKTLQAKNAPRASRETVPEVKPQFQPQPEVKVRPKKNKVVKTKPQPFSTARKKNNGPSLKTLLADNEPAVTINENIFDEMIEHKRLQKISQDEQKQQAQKLKKDKKRELKNQRRLNRSAHIAASSESEVSEEEKIKDEPSVMPSPVVQQVVYVELNDFEKKVFAMLTNSVPETERTKYKTYLVGGWAYDKVRKKILDIHPCTYNDADFTTEIPSIMLDIKIFKPIPEVPGLFCTTIDNVRIDIVCEPDLSNLLRDAKGRDFLTLYIDAEGKVSDPTGFALSNLLCKRLSGVNPSADMFKDDPLVILRAIYMATKRDLNFNSLKRFIKADRFLLIPKPVLAGATPDRTYEPRRFNLRFAKLFTQHLAAKNFQLLQSLGILEVLFPDIYPDMLKNIEWLTEQIRITNGFTWPKVHIIYANFITCAVISRVPDIELAYLSGQLYPSQLETTIYNIWDKSLLFRDTFKNPEDLYTFLRRPLMTWISNFNRNSVISEPIRSITLGR